MLQFKSRRVFSLVAIALATTAASPAVPRSPGFTFDMESLTTSQNPMSPTPITIKLTARGMVTSKGVMRMEIVAMDAPPGAPAPYAAGDYFLTQDGKMTLVHPATKTYVDMAEMATSAMNLPPQLMAQMTITDITGKTEKMTDGTPIEGRATEHYRTNISYSMNLMGMSLPTSIVNDYWAAKLPVKFVNPLLGGSRSPITTGPMVELINKQIELVPKLNDAIVVKSTSATTVNMMGQSVATTVTSEMKNLKESDVDDSKFTVPADYTKATKP